MRREGKRNTGLVVFDLDGTLVDSRRDIACSINAALRTVAGVSVPEEAVFPLIGRALDEMFALLLPRDAAGSVDEACAAYRAHYLDHCAVHTTVFPGVTGCLEALRGIRRAVATNKSTAQAVRAVRELGLAGHFDLVLGCDGIPRKPHPAVIERILEALGIDPGEACMVGDTVYDIEAGKAARLAATCAVTYGYGDRAALVAASPDLLLDDLGALPRLLRLR
jgi:2-phosphoglycolate phosphatase